MAKTYKEINEKIAAGKAVVVDAEEIIDIVKKDGLKTVSYTHLDVYKRQAIYRLFRLI